MMKTTLVMGAVAYDPKVIKIWDGFQTWLGERGLPFDYVLYSNYERQVQAHLAGDIDVAWNSPLAWLQTELVANATGRGVEAIAMRDSDCDLTSVVVVRADSEFRSLADLKGRTVGVGASDSPQATLIPLEHFAAEGVVPDRDFTVRRFDVLVGKHGDHVGGERDAAKALLAGEVDAACMIDGNYYYFGKDGTLPAGSTRIIAQTEEYDHCNFTVLTGGPTELIERFRALLLSMRYDDPVARPLLDLEGLKVWKPGRTDKYAVLSRAIERFGSTDAFVADQIKRLT
jgi:phosphonate transport system substrate-binding protein